MASAEIVSIGTELLLGQILNTNAQFLASEMAAAGIDCFWQTTCGDNQERIKDCIRQALNRVDIVVTTGGLGPTADDLTIECLADLFGVPLVFDRGSMDKIEDIFKSRGIRMVESNRKQALRPQGAGLLENPVGTAPGIIWKLEEDILKAASIERPSQARYVITLPGVPYEMKAMWAETVRPYLANEIGASAIWSCELKHYGIGESTLAELHAGLLSGTNPTVAPLAGRGECRLRVTAKADSVPEAMSLAAAVIEEIRLKSGLWCYGTDADTLETVVGKLLSERGMTVAFAESCTGGLVSKLLTDVPGSSRYINLNVVAYSNAAKNEILGVHDYVLSQKGAVSAECAHAMATGVRKIAHADIGFAITGIAGPEGGSPDKPVGLVYLALVAEHFQADKVLRFPAEMSRSEIRHRTASEALNMVRIFLIDPAKLKS